MTPDGIPLFEIRLVLIQPSSEKLFPTTDWENTDIYNQTRERERARKRGGEREGKLRTHSSK